MLRDQEQPGKLLKGASNGALDKQILETGVIADPSCSYSPDAPQFSPTRQSSKWSIGTVPRPMVPENEVGVPTMGPTEAGRAWEWARARDRWIGPAPVHHAKGKSEAKSLMRPQALARMVLPKEDYKALVQLADQGCPADCGPPWSSEVIEEAKKVGPHKSALTPAAAELIWEDIQYQVDAGFVRVVPEQELFGGSTPKELKISRVAVVPQENRRDRIILNLSADVEMPGSRRGIKRKHPSVNESTRPAEDQAPVQKLGHAVPELLRFMHDVDCSWEIMWQKIDLSDGFWRMIVEAGKEHNFVFQMPGRPGDDTIYYVVPSSLQMGWKNSPAYFCKATEVAKSMIARLLALSLEQGISNPHEHDQKVAGDVGETRWKVPADIEIEMQVFVDDFMNGVAGPPARPTKALEHQWVNRAAMHSIHSIFPRPDVLQHVGGKDSISAKKVAKGDATFDTTKELLGLVMTGEPSRGRVVGLSKAKVEKYCQAITDALNSPAHRIGYNSFQRILGKVQFASNVMPSMRGHFTPLNQALVGKSEGSFVGLGRKSQLRETLADLREHVVLTGEQPSHITELVPPDLPHYYGTVDASGVGLGGVLLPCTEWLPPLVWRVEMPPDLHQAVEKGTLTMVDCEFAAYFIGNLLLHDEVLATTGSMAGVNAHFFSDNSPTVGIVERQATRAKSPMPSRTLRWLSKRQRYYRTGPQTVQHWFGEGNTMADFPSRSYAKGFSTEADDAFLTQFSLMFPLPPQLGSWRIVRPRHEIVSAAYGLLRRDQGQTTPGNTPSGEPGASFPPLLARTLTWPASRDPPAKWNASTCSWPLLLPCGTAHPTATHPLAARKLRERFGSAGKSWQPEDLRTLAGQIKDNTT